MKNNQQQQAQRLFFQSDFTKTEIAETLGISRSTLDAWVAENHWDILRQCSSAMPSQLAENCYRIMAQLTQHILSPEREGQPVTTAEVNNLHKLSVTIGKLKSKVSLNESMETLAGFSAFIDASSPELAAAIAPLIDAYVQSLASAKDKGVSQSNKPALPHTPSTAPAPVPVVNKPRAPLSAQNTTAGKAGKETFTQSLRKSFRNQHAAPKSGVAA